MNRPRHDKWIRGLASQAESLGPDRSALVLAGRSIGYAELAEAAAQTRVSLQRLGLVGGDLIGVLAPPSLEGVVLIHALLDLGIVFLPLNARLSEAEQRHALASTRARFLLVSGVLSNEPDDLAEAAGVRLVDGLGTGLVRFAPVSGEVTLRAGVALSIRVEPSARAVEDIEHRRSRRAAEGAALVLQTSGTSGRPKGAVLSFDNLMASALGSGGLLGSHAADRWLLCMPLFHIGGLSILLRSALAGASVHLQPRFDAHEVVRAIEQDGISHVSLVAAMLERVLELRGERRPPKSLEVLLLGGGPASDELLARSTLLGYPVAPTYGLTEAASQVATRPPTSVVSGDDDLAGGLVVLPGVEVRIVDDAGHDVGAEVEGEVEVRGDIVMVGYLDDPEATRTAIRAGWLATGDIGRIDFQGRLRVFDRRADLILSGGENVYPAEIESMLVECDGVQDAGVFGVEDARFGARPVAVLVMQPGVDFDPAALASFCRGRMASYKRPIDFVEATSLPRTATGKLLRRELRRDYGGQR